MKILFETNNLIELRVFVFKIGAAINGGRGTRFLRDWPHSPRRTLVKTDSESTIQDEQNPYRRFSGQFCET